jgi:hypothetical protein
MLETLYVLVLNNPNKRQNPSRTSKMLKVIPTARAEEWFRSAFKVPEDDSNFCKALNDLKASLTGKENIAISKLAKKTFELFLVILQKNLGIEVEHSLTSDKKEVYLKLKVSENNLFLQAEFVKYPVRLRVNDERRFPFQAHLPYGHFTNRAHSKMVYDEREGEIFRYVDKVRILKTMMNGLIDFEELRNMDLLKDEFPMHNHELEKIAVNWLSFKNVLKPVDVDAIKDYFGEKVALYFAWLEFYTHWLILPTAIGVVCGILMLASDSDKLNVGYMTVGEWSLIVFAFLLSLCSTLFDQLWIRKQSVLAWRWGVTDYQKVEEQRAGFKGQMEYDPITGKIKKINHSNLSLRKLLAALVSIFFVGLVVAAVTGLLIYKAILTTSKDSSSARTIGFLNAIQIKVFNYIYRYVARVLNNWENYETQSEYMNALVVKLFSFQFINSYISLFYIAFLKSHFEGCTENDCLYDLTIQLSSIYFINLGLNLIELGLPVIKSKLKHRKFKNQVLSPEEHQSCLAGYDEPLDDYMEIVIGYGYLVLFGVAFPFTPLISLFLCLVEMKVDSFKLCKISKRPFPDKDSSIGIWLNVTQAIAVAGVITNVAVLIFTSDVFDFSTNAEQWIAFFIIEHVLLTFKFGLSVVIPDRPVVVQQGVQWTSRIANEKVYERFVNVNLEKSLKGLTFETPETSQIVRFEDIYKEVI